MTAELGQLALILALLTALAQGTVPLIGAHRRDLRLMALARPAAFGQLGFLAIAFAALVTAHVTSDFTVANVVENSHTAKPLLYKVSGVWGSHEGSMLLWVLMLAIFGGLVASRASHMPRGLAARTLAVQGLLGVGFLLFIIMTSNPFDRVFPAPLEGRDLNPLLQDPGLAFHPPFLYFGYVGFSTAFSFAAAGLIEGRVDPVWARCTRPYALISWCALTVGIAMGSWWSYYTLGWGGWWFWDPVENASFMPWLVGTALIHSLIVLERRDALNVWTVLLAIMTFTLSLVGTFLVRSGILTSVHAFAIDPARGVFILGLMAVAVAGAFGLFALRSPRLGATGLFRPISREGAVVLNNLLLSAAACTVFMGTLYPLFYEMTTGDKLSVGTGYFDRTFVPLMIPLSVAVAIGPLLAWRKGDLAAALSRLLAAAAAVVAVAAVYTYLHDGGPIMALVGMALAAWVGVGAVTEWADRVQLFRVSPAQSWARARGLPLRAYGMTLAHAGIGISIAGMVASTAWSAEQLVVVKAGETVKLAGYELRFAGVHPEKGPNYDAQVGTFGLWYRGAHLADLHSSKRVYPSTGTDKVEAAIRTTGISDVYVVLGDARPDGGWAVRAYYRPLIPWIWGGALLMALGGGLALLDRVRVQAGVRARAGAAVAGLAARASAVLLAIGLGLALAGPAAAVEPEEQLKDPALEARARALGQDLRCVVCQNQSIDDSHAALAADLRRILREHLQKGESDDQVRAFFLARYGDFITFTPPMTPGTYLLWGAPVLAVALGALGFARLWRRSAVQPPEAPPPLTAEEEAVVARALDPETVAQLRG